TIKPEPAIYRQMIEQLGCEASAIAMIGDTLQADMLGPIGQGMRGYHLQREGKADQCGFVSLMDFAAHVLQYPPSANG
ncbi:HAD family hydrolase, partial [Stutzerimonas balearica]